MDYKNNTKNMLKKNHIKRTNKKYQKNIEEGQYKEYQEKGTLGE